MLNEIKEIDPIKFAESMTRFEVKLDQALKELEELKTAINVNYVTKLEFWPVRALVYGFAALVFTSVVGAVLALVIMR